MRKFMIAVTLASWLGMVMALALVKLLLCKTPIIKAKSFVNYRRLSSLHRTPQGAVLEVPIPGGLPQQPPPGPAWARKTCAHTTNAPTVHQANPAAGHNARRRPP